MARARRNTSYIKLFSLVTVVALGIATLLVAGIVKRQQDIQSNAASFIHTTSLFAAPTTVQPGGSATAIWYVLFPSADDWVGLYHTGASDTSYISRQYLGSCTRRQGNGPNAVGICRFTFPQTQGTYEFRLFKQGTYTKVATSNTVTVLANNPGPSVTPFVSCFPPPPCVYSEPRCYIQQPVEGWCGMNITPSAIPSNVPLTPNAE